MIKRIVDLNHKIITKYINKTVYITRNIKFNNIFSLNKFSFVESKTPKIIKIIKDENNQNKIIYKNFDESEIEQKNSKAEFKDKQSFVKNDNNNFKLKIFGITKLETNNVSKSNSEKVQREENDFNVFNDTETKFTEETRDEKLSEEVHDNLLNYNSFFSDYCRVYVRAGDGGNGSISILKGPMFDQGN